MVLSGFIYDKTTGEILVGASIIEPVSGKGTITNAYGFYSILIDNLDSSSVVRATFVGYSPSEVLLSNIKESRHNFYLTPGIELQEFTITAGQVYDLTKTAEIGVTRLPMQDVRMMPNFFGEVDIIKAFQMTPGVQSGGEGKSELFIRGGSPDQNLVLLDDIPLYYVAHFGGFFSIFNSDAISDVALIKGGFPARYGGRLSSVLEVRMKDGNMNKFQGQGAVGLLSSKLMLEGPLVKEKSSFMISARGSLIPVYKLLFQNLINYNFYDLNGKLNYKLTDNDRLLFSFYAGNDIVVSRHKEESTNQSNFMRYRTGWGNLALSLRYNKVFNSRLFGNFMLAHSRYRYSNGFENTMEYKSMNGFQVQSKLLTGISDWLFKADFTYNVLPDYQIRFGASTTHHTSRPNDETFRMTQGGQAVNRFYNSVNQSLESGVYIENEVTISNVNLNLGLRGVNFLLEKKTYSFLEPRLSLNIPIGNEFSLKGAFSKTNQFMHFLSYSGAGIPADYWMPSTANVKPSGARQFNIGFAKLFSNKTLQLTIDGYWKDLKGMVSFKPGGSLVGNLSSWENVIEQNGKGTNYGIEVFLQKTAGRSTGWLGVTLSRAFRQFDNLNQGKNFPFKYDRLLDLSLVWNYKMSEKINVSAAWAFGSGYPITLASERFYLEGYPYFVYEGINSYRMRSFHRLDLSLNHTSKTNWGESTWSISIFNVYNRKNPYYYFYGWTFAPTANNPNYHNLTLKQRTLFPFFPTISYNFKF